MKNKLFVLNNYCLLHLGFALNQRSFMGSTQNVTVSGAVNNSSSGSGKAMINVGSTVVRVLGSTQIVVVKWLL